MIVRSFIRNDAAEVNATRSAVFANSRPYVPNGIAIDRAYSNFQLITSAKKLNVQSADGFSLSNLGWFSDRSQ